METPQEFDIKQYLQLLYQRRYLFVVVVVIITSIAIAISYALPKIYEAKTTVLIESNYVNDLMKNIAVTPSINDRVKALEAILKSRTLILKVVGELDLDLTRKSDVEVEKLVRNFQKAMDITYGIGLNKPSGSNMDMFTVSFRDANPVVARDFVNVLVRRYIEDNLSHNRDATFGANKFLLEQIGLVKDKISTIEADIARMSKLPDTVAVAHETVAQDRLRVLQKRLYELRLQYTDNHPDIIKLKAEIESLRSQSVGGKPVAAAGRKDEQQQPGLNLDDTTPRNNIVPDLEKAEAGNMSNDPAGKTPKRGNEFSTSKLGDRQKISSLERDRDTYKKIYEDLMATMARSEVSSHIEVEDKGGTFKILEPAILPFSPVSPNRVKIILLGLLAGVGGGVIFIILLDKMDNSVKTLDSARSFGLPVLATIPHMQNLADIQKKKRNDLVLYIVAGVYLICVAGLISFEFFKRGVQ